MKRGSSAKTFLRLACLAGFLLAVRPAAYAAGPSTAVDPAKQAAWEAAQVQAGKRVEAFDNAVRSGNPETIKKAALDLQSDPYAMQKLNAGNEALIKAHVDETTKIKNAAKQNIKNEMAKKWNAANPDKPPITPDDVDFYEPTNYKKPDAKIKSGQDWDVTVRVKGKDVPPEMSKSAVDKGYFDAAGGEKTFGPKATPESVAHKQQVETTSGKSTEAYNEPEKILGTKDKPPDPKSKLADPEQLGKTIENKSQGSANKAADARAKAAEARAAGNEAQAKAFETEALQHDLEQMRQASKQYDNITKPRVEAAGGKVNSHVDEGVNIMRDAGAGKISPEEARAKLAKIGETPESIINKAAGQAEAAQKLQPTSKASSSGDGGKTTRTPTDTPDGTTRTPLDTPEGVGTRTPVDTPEGKPTTLDTPEGKIRGPLDTPEGVGTRTPTDTPDGTTRAPLDTPEGVGTRTPTDTPDGTTRAPLDTPEGVGTRTPTDTPEGKPTTLDTPEGKIRGPLDTPEGVGTRTPTDTPDGTTRTPTDTPEGGGTRTPTDTPEGGAPKTTVDGPDGKVRGPAVDGPDGAPGAGATKAGKALEVVGKGMVAVDILSGAEDIKQGIKAGDGKKVAEAGVNIVDGFTGGAIGTGRMLNDRNNTRNEKNEAQADARKAAEEAQTQEMWTDLRKGGFTKEEVAAIMDARAKGDDGPLKAGYEKLGKDVPDKMATDPTWKESAGNYVTEVGENVTEVAVGIKDKTVKAGKFVKEAGEDVTEIASGLTDSNVRNEVLTEVKGNLSKENWDAKDEADAADAKADQTIKEGAQKLADQMTARGIDPAEAKKAADAYYAGDRTLLDAQIKQVKDAKAAKEAAEKKDKEAQEGSDKPKTEPKDKLAGKDKKTGKDKPDGPESDGAEKGTTADGKGKGTATGGRQGVDGEEGGQGGDKTDSTKPEEKDDGSPRNDGGQKVDPGAYEKGDTIVTQDGTEYVKTGSGWEKTGENYGPYDPDKGGDKGDKTGKGDKGDLKGNEADLGGDGDDGASGGKGTLVGEYTKGFTKTQGDKVDGGMNGMDGNKILTEATTSGDEASLSAKNTLNEGGANADKIKNDSATKIASADGKESWGSKLGTAVADGVEQGGAAFGGAVGQGAADKSWKKKTSGKSGSGKGDGDDGDDEDDGDDDGDAVQTGGGDTGAAAGTPAKGSGGSKGGGKKDEGNGNKGGGGKLGGNKGGGGSTTTTTPGGGKAITVTSSGDASESSSGGYASGPQDKTISIGGKLKGKKVTGVKVRLTYNANSIPDAFSIIYEGASLAGSGSVSYGGTLTGKGAGSAQSVTIRVVSSSDQNTQWDWSATATFYVEDTQTPGAKGAANATPASAAASVAGAAAAAGAGKGGGGGGWWKKQGGGTKAP